MHGTGVFSAGGRNRHFRLKRHATARTRAGLGLPYFRTHGANVAWSWLCGSGNDLFGCISRRGGLQVSIGISAELFETVGATKEIGFAGVLGFLLCGRGIYVHTTDGIFGGRRFGRRTRSSQGDQTRWRPGLKIFLRVSLEFFGAMSATEIELLPLILAAVLSSRGVDGHAAHRIFRGSFGSARIRGHEPLFCSLRSALFQLALLIDKPCCCKIVFPVHSIQERVLQNCNLNARGQL